MDRGQAIATLEAFVSDELETRERSYLPDPGEDGTKYLDDANAAMEAVKFLKLPPYLKNRLAKKAKS